MQKQLKIKVCGMRDQENILQIADCNPDYLGFIFYPKSKRYVGEKIDVGSVPKQIQKAGVFVNEEIDELLKICHTNNLQVAQLHGNENPEYCKKVKEADLVVFKAFAIDQSFDFSVLNNYSGTVNYFLFDTKGDLPGGTGEKFEWKLLDNYKLDIPFFLSGGIKPEDVLKIKAIIHPQLYGVDINSGFETAPAMKDVSKVSQFIKSLRLIY